MTPPGGATDIDWARPGTPTRTPAIEPQPGPGRSIPGAGGTAVPVWHEVKESETLSSIARQYYGAERYWTALADANPGIDERAMRPGKRLRIPPMSEVVTSSGSTRSRSRTC